MPAVIDALPRHTQEMLTDAAIEQFEDVTDAQMRLASSDGQGFFGPGVVEQAAHVLDAYSRNDYTEDGFVRGDRPVMPLYVPFGANLGDGVRAFSSTRLPLEGSSNAWGMRPNDPANLANQAGLYALLGVNTDNMVFVNNGSNGANVEVIESARDIINPTGHRNTPATGEGDNKTAGAVIMLRPNEIGKGLVEANADNPVAVGTVYNRDTGLLEAQMIINLGWQNIENGIVESTAATLRDLGLAGSVIRFAVGVGARRGFEVTRAKLLHPLGARSIDRQPHDVPTKTYLELTEEAAIGLTAINLGQTVETLPLCTVSGAKAGILHSSRKERTEKTPPGMMSGGDRGLTGIIPPVLSQG